MRRWTFILLFGGLVALLLAHWLNRPSYWRPLVISSVETETSFLAELTPGTDYEITFEFSESVSADVRAALSSPSRQTIIDGRWGMVCGEQRVAGGESSGYLRITRVRSWLGESFRVFTRVPFGADETKYHSIGIGGNFLTERVFGAFRTSRDHRAPCRLTWDSKKGEPEVRVAVRRANSEWARHAARYAWLPLVGFTASGVGFLCGLYWRLIRRSSASHDAR